MPIYNGGNLPPGVTGREDAFGPQDEPTGHRECGAFLKTRVYSKAITDELEALSQVIRGETGPLLYSVRKRLFALMSEVRDSGQSAVTEIDCPFEGQVDLQVWNVTITWECPLCGTKHVEDREDSWG
jgi:hypothetical protein